MPSKDSDGKRIPGNQQRKKARTSARRMTRASGLADVLPPPPADDLLLQLWGARCAAALAYKVVTDPKGLKPEQWRFAREYLATLGLLFPRAAVVKRMQKEIEKRKGKSEEEDTKSLDGIDPGPTGRFGGGKRPSGG